MKIVLVSALMACMSAGIASSATFNIVGSFSGGQLGDVEFDIDIDLEAFVASLSVPNPYGHTGIRQNDTDIGITVNSLTSSEVPGNPFVLGDGLGYNYLHISDNLRIGGLHAGISGLDTTTEDFLFDIYNFSTVSGLVEARATDSISTLPGWAGSVGVAGALNATAIVTRTSSAPIPDILTQPVPIGVGAEVPLPAGLPLLATGILGLAGLRSRVNRIWKD